MEENENNFHVTYLVDNPDYYQACAAWSYGRWGVQNPQSSLDKSLQRFREGAQKDALPLTRIAVHAQTGWPAGMGSLWVSDSDVWTSVTPWIASVFTLYRYRGQGIASRIIEHLEDDARRLGFDRIYLKSGSAAPFYQKRGFTAVETRKTDETAAGQETLFEKRVS